MGMETASLIINRIDWRYLKPNEVTSHGMAAPIKSSIKWMEVKCKNCQHEWKTYEGDQVEYDIEDSDRGQHAINIKKLKSA